MLDLTVLSWIWQKAQATKENTNQLDFMKIKKIFASKHNIIIVKGNSQNGRKYL